MISVHGVVSPKPFAPPTPTSNRRPRYLVSDAFPRNFRRGRSVGGPCPHVPYINVGRPVKAAIRCPLMSDVGVPALPRRSSNAGDRKTPLDRHDRKSAVRHLWSASHRLPRISWITRVSGGDLADGSVGDAGGAWGATSFTDSLRVFLVLSDVRRAGTRARRLGHWEIVRRWVLFLPHVLKVPWQFYEWHCEGRNWRKRSYKRQVSFLAQVSFPLHFNGARNSHFYSQT